MRWKSRNVSKHRIERSQLAKYAQEYRLLASQGSDFHQPCAWVELGRKLRLPGGVEPVWRDWSNSMT